ncbi:HalOD1 output domain-containing protein [Natrinema sp. H-ect1]|uniref:HalOD1 output domain-containing protein n=1 Tax=Natrinema sp. H-ect1 TaxID=3242700 RepID=UPI00359D5EB9
MVEGGDTVGEPSNRPPSQAVIEAVAEAEGVQPEGLAPPAYEPLHAVVDPTALDGLFAARSDGRGRPSGTVSFRFCGYDVTVDRDGRVTLEEAVERAD